MCGRFVITAPLEAILRLFGVDDRLNLGPRYNVAPTQDVPVVRCRAEDEGRRELVLVRWGLIPSWAKDAAIGNRLVNARAETVAETPAFRESFRRRRCLVVADGFYEWARRGAGKQPYLIRLASGDPFGFAGLWSRWQAPDGSRVESCTIVTTAPNALVAPIHDRMPVILAPEDHEAWLDPAGGEAAQRLLRPFPAERMALHPVSPRVGNPRNDDAGLIEPVAEPRGSPEPNGTTDDPQPSLPL